MLKKRLIGVVTILQGLAVQSFGFNRYLPLGTPEVLVENLDRWNADEILIQCIDRSVCQIGPDFSLLERVGSLGLSTPLIYAGGIRNVEEAIKVVSLGADRILLNSMLWDDPQQIQHISKELGTQAVIASMPVRVEKGKMLWLDYRTKNEVVLSNEDYKFLPFEWVSEILLTDWLHDGISGGFDNTIPAHFPIKNKPLIVFGGISKSSQYEEILSCPNVMAICIGNFLNYKEHAIQSIRQKIVGQHIRSAQYAMKC